MRYETIGWYALGFSKGNMHNHKDGVRMPKEALGVIRQ